MAGDTPLHIVARCGLLVKKNPEWKDQLIGCLLDAGADLSVKNLEEESPEQLLRLVKVRPIIHHIAQARRL